MKKRKTISKDDFISYLSSEKGSQRHKVERDALSDPFLEEAIEGFEEWNNSSGSINAIQELDNRIRPAQNKWRIMGTAAAVLLMLGLTMFWIKNLSEDTSQLAIKTEEKKLSSPSETTDSISKLLNPEVINPVTPSDAYIQEDDRAKNGPSHGDIPPGRSEELSNKDVEEDNISLPWAGTLSKENVPVTKPVSTDTMSYTLAEVAEEKEELKLDNSSGSTFEYKKSKDVSSVKQKRKAESAKSERAAPSPSSVSDDVKGEVGVVPIDTDAQDKLKTKMTEAKNLYQQKDFKRSLKICTEILSENPVLAEALYYSGLNERQLGNPKKALNHFEKVNKLSIFYYNSRWNMYELLTSDTVKSRAILSELAAEPNEYQDKARVLLKQ